MDVIGIGMFDDIGDGILAYAASVFNRQAKITDDAFLFLFYTTSPDKYSIGVKKDKLLSRKLTISFKTKNHKPIMLDLWFL